MGSIPMTGQINCMNYMNKTWVLVGADNKTIENNTFGTDYTNITIMYSFVTDDPSVPQVWTGVSNSAKLFGSTGTTTITYSPACSVANDGQKWIVTGMGSLTQNSTDVSASKNVMYYSINSKDWIPVVTPLPLSSIHTIVYNNYWLCGGSIDDKLPNIISSNNGIEKWSSNDNHIFKECYGLCFKN